MNVRRHDHPLRFLVTSENRPDIDHLVDLGEFGGFGECSCEDFEFRILPVIAEKGTSGLTRCKHLIAARSTLADIVIAKLS